MKPIQYQMPNPSRFFLRHERQLKKIIGSYFNDIANYITSSNVSELNLYNFIDKYFDNKQETVEFVLNIYRSVGKWYAIDAFNSINAQLYKKADFEFIINTIIRYLEINGLSKITNINETLKNDIKELIFKAFEEGLSPIDVAKLLVKQGKQIALKRAITIARTEIIGAANAGALAGAKETRVISYKVWVSSSDKRTRNDHREARNQKVAINENFKIGGEELAHPGDKNASAKQVVNCRCTMLFSSK